MPESNHTILDRDDPVSAKKWFESPLLFWLSFPVIFIGVIFKLQHWPWATMMLIAGSGITLLRLSLIFLKRKRQSHEWLYFLGGMAVIVWIILFFVFDVRSSLVKLVFMLLFAAGILGYLFKPSNKAGLLKEDIQKEEEEQDDI